jgi:hypothetical protein
VGKWGPDAGTAVHDHKCDLHRLLAHTSETDRGLGLNLKSNLILKCIILYVLVLAVLQHYFLYRPDQQAYFLNQSERV